MAILHLSGKMLGGRYRLDREVGAGGMATVYLAEDLKHHRQVAVKLLNPEVAAVLGSERFLHEIEVAARFTHPHILPLHDSGEADGFLYYVTPYIEGESLRHRLERDRQLPIEEAVRITRQVAGALDYAHRQGVVHRDVKPENVLMQDGEALVADFGVARALAASGRSGLTQTGVVLGTPAYMSPEQIAGAADLDARSDIYSLGCVLYELLTGEPPFAAVSPGESMSRRLIEAAPRVSSRRQMVSPAIDAALTKALARTPADRFASAARFSEALESGSGTVASSPGAGFRHGRRWLPVAAALVITIAIAGYVLSRNGSRPDPPTSVPRLAVLPFENLGAPQDEYFADGITDEITARLAGLSGLAVIARHSAVRYKNSSKTPQQIGEELGAAYLLEATVSWQRGPGERNRIRVRPQLIRTSDATHVWADVYDEDLMEVFAVQTRIARSVVTGLGVALLDREQSSLAAAPTRNSEAHDHYLRGMQYANHSEAFNERDYRIAIPLLQKAVELDPTFALAHAALSRAHLWMHWYAIDRSDERMLKAKHALDQALALEPGLPEARIAQALYYYGRYEYAYALKILTDLRERQPHHAEVLFNTGLVLRRQGNMEEATARLEDAIRVNPRSTFMVYNLGETYWLLRKHAEADTWLSRAIAFSPDAVSPYSLRARNLVAWKGATSDAWRVLDTADTFGIAADHRIAHQRVWLHLLDRDFEKAIETARGGPQHEAFDWQFWFVPRTLWLGEIYQLQNQSQLARSHYEAARDVLESRVRRFPSDPRYYSSLGIAYAGLGRSAAAVQTATKAIELLPPSMEAYRGPYAVEALARVYALTGDRDAAVRRLTELIDRPSHISRAILRLDPRWGSLRNHQGFQQLAAAR